MCESKPSRPDAGFSLIEMLVALFFTAILTTGMLRIFATSVNGFYAQQETLGIQRASRFAMEQVQEDFLQAGYLFPPRSLRGQFNLGSTTAQPPLLIQQTSYTPTWTDPNGTSATLNPVDEIQFVQDLNLNVEGTLSATTAVGDITATVNIPSGVTTIQNYLSATSGSLSMIMLDSQANSVDMLKVKAISGTGPYTITLDSGVAASFDEYGNPTSGGFFTGSFNNVHAVDAPCTFIAPLQVVRYSVVSRALDPADPTNLIPCLVRQTAPLDKTTIFAPAVATVPAAPNTEQIIAEGVTGFKVDISLDGGNTWLRYNSDGTLKASADSWSNFYAILETAIKASAASGSSLYNYAQYGLNNQTDPLWTNYIPVTLRLDIQTTTRMARSDYGQTGANPNQLGFRTRTTTMLLSPRNFALGSPQ